MVDASLSQPVTATAPAGGDGAASGAAAPGDGAGTGGGAAAGGAHDTLPGTTAAPRVEPNAGARKDALSVDDAERFAASFRPSWEPAAPSAPRSPVPTPLSPLPAAMPEPEPEVDVSLVPGAREKKRALMMTAGAVAGFVLLGALGLMSSLGAPRAPEPAHAPAPALEHAKPAPAAAPPAAPSAAPQPQELGATPEAKPPVPEPSAPEPAAPAPAAAPPTPLVHLRVSASPSDAELLIDGARVANPYEGDAPKGSRMRVLAQASGYHSHDVTLSLDQDRSLDVHLDKIRVAARPRHVHVRVHHPRPVQRAPSPAKPAPQPKGAGFVSESPY